MYILNIGKVVRVCSRVYMKFWQSFIVGRGIENKISVNLKFVSPHFYILVFIPDNYIGVDLTEILMVGSFKLISGNTNVYYEVRVIM